MADSPKTQQLVECGWCSGFGVVRISRDWLGLGAPRPDDEITNCPNCKGVGRVESQRLEQVHHGADKP